MAALGDSFSSMASCKRFWDTLEEAASSWESAVDMVLARMPDSTSPASSAGRMPKRDRKAAIWTMTVSVSEAWRRGSRPLALMAQPAIPMTSTSAMEMVTHTEATRRESVSLFSSSMAINRSRKWGIPR